MGIPSYLRKDVDDTSKSTYFKYLTISLIHLHIHFYQSFRYTFNKHLTVNNKTVTRELNSRKCKIEFFEIHHDTRKDAIKQRQTIYEKALYSQL